MIDHIVEDTIKRVAKGFTKEETLSFVCPGVFEEVCKKNGWQFELDSYYNGWEVDWCAYITVDSYTINVCGCMYYGTANLTLGQNE